MSSALPEKAPGCETFGSARNPTVDDTKTMPSSGEREVLPAVPVVASHF